MRIKNRSYYFWDDVVHLDDFDENLLKLVKRELQIGGDVYYVGYVVKNPEYNIYSVNPLYISIRNLLGCAENIDDSNNGNKYLIVDEANKEVLNVLRKLFKFTEYEIFNMKKKVIILILVMKVFCSMIGIK